MRGSRTLSRSAFRTTISDHQDDTLPCRPTKPKLVQYHVTTDDISPPSPQKRPPQKRLPPMDHRALPPPIPERTTSLPVEVPREGLGNERRSLEIAEWKS